MFAVKICGIRTAQDAAICVAEGADALGFIFAGGPAKLELAAAREIATAIPAFVTRVGVFADQPWQFVHRAIDGCRLDMLQFCGSETGAFRGSFELPTIATLGIDYRAREATPPTAAFLRDARAVAILIDSRDGERVGGTGLRVDVRLASRIAQRSPLPCILAGGLTAENVGDAISAVGPAAVDVRSAVERGGRKDAELVRGFVRAAAAARRLSA